MRRIHNSMITIRTFSSLPSVVPAIKYISSHMVKIQVKWCRTEPRRWQASNPSRYNTTPIHEATNVHERKCKKCVGISQRQDVATRSTFVLGISCLTIQVIKNCIPMHIFYLDSFASHCSPTGMVLTRVVDRTSSSCVGGGYG